VHLDWVDCRGHVSVATQPFSPIDRGGTIGTPAAQLHALTCVTCATVMVEQKPTGVHAAAHIFTMSGGPWGPPCTDPNNTPAITSDAVCTYVKLNNEVQQKCMTKTQADGFKKAMSEGTLPATYADFCSCTTDNCNAAGCATTAATAGSPALGLPLTAAAAAIVAMAAAMVVR